jgi:hypothetical protein
MGFLKLRVPPQYTDVQRGISAELFGSHHGCDFCVINCLQHAYALAAGNWNHLFGIHHLADDKLQDNS